MSFTQRLAAYFRAQPHVWIDGRELATIAGCYAWRSRVSDCRRDLGMTIEHRLVKVGKGVASQYRYIPPEGHSEAITAPPANQNDWSLQ